MQNSQNPGGDRTDWVLVQQIERDICYLYHQMAEFGGLMGDLDYGPIYALPYWEYLEMQLPEDEYRRRFIRDGCLVMIFAMCDEFIMGAGWYIEPYVSTCLCAVSRLEPEDEQAAKLIESVKTALRMVKGDFVPKKEFDWRYRWIFQTYVGGYFRGIVDELMRNPYYNES